MQLKSLSKNKMEIMLLSGAVFCTVMLVIDIIAEKVKENSKEISEDSKD